MSEFPRQTAQSAEALRALKINTEGNALAAKGKLKEAKKKYEEALAIDPTNQTIKENLDSVITDIEASQT